MLLYRETATHADTDALQVSLSDILEHFNGSDKKSVLDLLSNLEADFSIYMKNNVYRIM